MLQIMLCRIVIQVDFVENFTTKINCLGKSIYWAYNQVTFCIPCVWKHGGTPSIVIVSHYLQYGRYAENVFLKNHSATVHQFQKVVIFSDGAPVNLNWAYCCLALHSLE